MEKSLMCVFRFVCVCVNVAVSVKKGKLFREYRDLPQQFSKHLTHSLLLKSKRTNKLNRQKERVKRKEV